MMSASEKEDSSFNITSFATPETVLCVDTICRICYAEFLDEEDLRVHITQQHTSDDTLSRSCQFCSYIYCSLDDYSSHIINVHILDLKCCKYCLRVFTNNQDVKGHEKKHLSNSTFELNCSNCNLTFKNVSSLEKHEISEHSEEDGVILKDCFSLLSSYLNINASIFFKSLGDSQEYKCVRCDFTTMDVDYYLQHLQQKNCKCLVCDVCFNVFKNIKTLKEHYKTICYSDNLNLPCKKCLKMFTYKEMEEHMKLCNEIKCDSNDLDSEKKITDKEAQLNKFSIKTCKYCHTQYVGQDALDKHVKRTHNKNMHLYKYFCIYCDNIIYNHPKKLFNHFYKNHKKLEPFTCKICDKTFRMRKHFSLHIKLSHLSAGNVKFDDKYHVIFEQNDFTKNFNENKNKDGTKSLLEPVKDKIQDDIEKDSNPLENGKDNSKDKQLQGDSEVVLVLYPTDKETDRSEIKKEKRLIKRKHKKNNDRSESIDLMVNDSEESDEEPLIMKRRRAKMRVENIKFPKWLEKSKLHKRNRIKFTCKICKKYCYTYQNYQHHMTLHKNNISKKCIKCQKVFKTTEKLKRHIYNEHSTSKLTETLKNVLERRKQINKHHKENKPIKIEKKYNREKFAKTIKKVNINTNDTAVNIEPVIDKLSVRKFIENFTPETTGINNKGSTVYINNSLTIKPIKAPRKPPLFKLIKSKNEQLKFTGLKQPERFRTINKERYDVSIKIADPESKPKMNFDQIQETIPESNSFEETNDDSMDCNIPEVAEEVMLDDTVEAPKDNQNIPENNSFQDYKEYRIAHLTPTEPYYKVVTVKNIGLEKPKTFEHQEKQINLPDGTKLVTVNPLAHLLQGKHVDLKTNKYYKSKMVDVEKAVATALLNAKNTTKPKKSKKTKLTNEQ